MHLELDRPTAYVRQPMGIGPRPLVRWWYNTMLLDVNGCMIHIDTRSKSYIAQLSCIAMLFTYACITLFALEWFHNFSAWSDSRTIPDLDLAKQLSNTWAVGVSTKWSDQNIYLHSTNSQPLDPSIKWTYMALTWHPTPSNRLRHGFIDLCFPVDWSRARPILDAVRFKEEVWACPQKSNLHGCNDAIWCGPIPISLYKIILYIRCVQEF